MDDLFGDERIQFFLRNRADIKAWAAIESDVIAATRELLARAQPEIEERLLAADPSVLVARHDSRSRERIMARRETWPASVALALEWHERVDPLGGAKPKLGLFWWADPVSLVEPRSQFVARINKVPLQKLGFKVPLDGVWPTGLYVASAADWWQDPDAWVGGLVDRFVEVWPSIAPTVDEVLNGVWAPPERPTT